MSIEIQNVALTALHPYANNPRNNEAAVEKVALSIQTFGFLVPIVAKPDGEILAGHTRYAASLRLGLKAVPVVYAEDLDDAKAKAFRLADNKVAEAGTWDFGKLAEELDDIKGVEDIDLEGFGFDGDINLDSFFDEGLSESSEEEKKEEKKSIICPHCGKEFTI